uniref:Uncharacterized protein n=1 Tax=Anguilla anguilla TaxID=7936 RepID=A0A0E9PY86_ANGAN
MAAGGKNDCTGVLMVCLFGASAEMQSIVVKAGSDTDAVYPYCWV